MKLLTTSLLSTSSASLQSPSMSYAFIQSRSSDILRPLSISAGLSRSAWVCSADVTASNVFENKLSKSSDKVDFIRSMRYNQWNISKFCVLVEAVASQTQCSSSTNLLGFAFSVWYWSWVNSVAIRRRCLGLLFKVALSYTQISISVEMPLDLSSPITRVSVDIRMQGRCTRRYRSFKLTLTWFSD